MVLSLSALEDLVEREGAAVLTLAWEDFFRIWQRTEPGAHDSPQSQLDNVAYHTIDIFGIVIRTKRDFPHPFPRARVTTRLMQGERDLSDRRVFE